MVTAPEQSSQSLPLPLVPQHWGSQELHPTHRIAGVGSLHLGQFADVSVEDIHLLHQARQGCFSGFPHLLIDFF